MSTRLHCSFCLRPDSEVRKLVAGAGGGYICDACASIAVRIMADSDGSSLWSRMRSRVRDLVRGDRGGIHSRTSAAAA